jgi:hypothetical protein
MDSVWSNYRRAWMIGVNAIIDWQKLMLAQTKWLISQNRSWAAPPEETGGAEPRDGLPPPRRKRAMSSGASHHRAVQRERTTSTRKATPSAASAPEPVAGATERSSRRAYFDSLGASLAGALP